MSVFDLIIQSRYWFMFCLYSVKVLVLRFFSKNKKIIFVLSTPRHGNLGDHAIVYSQYKLFESIGYKHRIIEFNETLYAVCKNAIQKIILNDDIVIIDGGGNIGTLWPKEEAVIRDIITRFHNTPVFIMPETAFFEKSEFGKRVLSESIQIYSSHPNLTVFCRDEVTFRLFSEKFKKVKSYYVPDMVMFISDIHTDNERKGTLICFREDLEGVLSESTKSLIVEEIKSRKRSISFSSTLIEHRINLPWFRKKQLLRKWSEFSQAEFVITDRLHGMIFCAITGTPCLAVDNVSHKVRDGYLWIKHLPYILYCDNEEEIADKICQLFEISSQKFTYDSSPLTKHYKLIKDKILNA